MTLPVSLVFCANKNSGVHILVLCLIVECKQHIHGYILPGILTIEFTFFSFACRIEIKPREYVRSCLGLGLRWFADGTVCFEDFDQIFYGLDGLDDIQISSLNPK